jgi:hypothetical protein
MTPFGTNITNAYLCFLKSFKRLLRYIAYRFHECFFSNSLLTVTRVNEGSMNTLCTQSETIHIILERNLRSGKGHKYPKLKVVN